MGKKKSSYEEIVDEAREEFDLRARLAGLTKRERTVTVFTDEVTGEELGGVEVFYYPGTDTVQNVRRWGVRGEQHALRDRLNELLKQEDFGKEDVAAAQEQAESLAKKAAELQKKLDASALVYEIRAVPEIVLKRSRREAFKNLGIKPKGGTTWEQDEDVRDEYLAIVLAESVVKYVDNASGATHTLTLDDARALQQFLLPEEWAKLEGALDELQARRAIGDAGTADADF